MSSSLAAPESLLWRKLFHAFNATWGVLLYHFLVPRWMALAVVGVLTLLLGVAEILRLRSEKINRQFRQHRFFGRMLRPGEVNRVSGSFYFALGVLAVLWFFPKPVVEAACLAMGYGDSASAMVGSRFGSVRLLSGRSLQGSLAFVAVTFLVVAAFRLAFYPDTWVTAALWGAIAGGTGALAEQASIFLDDNLLVPVFTSGALLAVL